MNKVETKRTEKNKIKYAYEGKQFIIHSHISLKTRNSAYEGKTSIPSSDESSKPLKYGYQGTKYIIYSDESSKPPKYGYQGTKYIIYSDESSKAPKYANEGKKYIPYSGMVAEDKSVNFTQKATTKCKISIADNDDIEELSLDDILCLPRKTLQMYLDKFHTSMNTLSSQCLLDYVKSSAYINNTLLEYIATSLPLYDEKSLDCVQKLLGSCISLRKDLTVYHGSKVPLHAPNSTNFSCDAFLSTSLTPKVSSVFGEYIYQIRIPQGLNVIIPENNLSELEIILPVGTIIENITAPFYDSKTYFTFMKADIPSAVENNNRVQVICNMLKCQQLKFKGVNRARRNLLIRKNAQKTNMDGSNEVIKVTGEDGVDYVIKRPTTPWYFKETQDEYIIRRMINEYVAYNIYKFYGVKTFDYFFVKYNDDNYLASNHIEGIQYNWETNLAFDVKANDSTFVNGVCDGFLIDCILCNWDICAPKNMGLLNGEVIRTDVGGSLAFRAKGEIRKAFYVGNPGEHISILANNDNIRQTFALYDIERLYAAVKNVNINNLYDVILSKFSSDTYEPSDHLKAFIKSIVLRVQSRHEFYLKNEENVMNFLRNYNFVMDGGSTTDINETDNDTDIEIGGYTKEQFLDALLQIAELGGPCEMKAMNEGTQRGGKRVMKI